jgi:hypothetical protein
VIESKATEFLRISVQQLADALAEGDPGIRRLKLRSYWFPNPSKKWEYAMVFVNIAIALILARHLLSQIRLRDTSFLGLALCVPLAFFVADTMSSAFHKWLDSYACEANRVWGSAAKAYRIHHEFPNNLNETTYLHNVSAFAPFITGLWLLFYGGAVLAGCGVTFRFFVWLLVLMFSHGTEIHKLSHRRKVRRSIRLMQKIGLFLPPSVHKKHHSGFRNQDYGIINGWSNGIFRAFAVWPRLDLWLWNHFRIFPHNWIHEPDSIPPTVVQEMIDSPDLLPGEIEIYLQLFPSRGLGPIGNLIRSQRLASVTRQA